jgi:hypothetical protein
MPTSKSPTDKKSEFRKAIVPILGGMAIAALTWAIFWLMDKYMR